jgi:hypothetical protein
MTTRQLSIDGFILPKNPAKRPRSNTLNNTNTHNKFSSLKEVILPNPSIKKRVPPIFLKSSGHTGNLSVCDQFVKNYFLTYQKNGNVRVQVSTLDDFQALKTGLKSLNREFHSFSLGSEKPKKTVIRGLPSISIEEIKSGLSEKGLSPTEVFAMRGRNGEPTRSPLYLVHFSSDTDLSALKSITNICHCKVTFQKYKTKGTFTQCFRCQRHGHAAANCNRLSRCVKCGSDHPTASCNKSTQTPAKCCNCGGDHTANFKNCPAREAYIQLKKPFHKKSPDDSAPQEPKSQHQKSFVGNLINGRSWAAVTKGIAGHPVPELPPTPLSAATSAEMPISELMQLVLKVRDLQLKLRSCSSKEERMLLIMELAASMENV